MTEDRDTAPTPTIESLEKEREKYVTRIFWFALEIALIFLLPALFGILLYHFMAPGNALWHPLPLTFIISWFLVILKYKKLHKKLSGLDKQIKQLKSEQQ